MEQIELREDNYEACSKVADADYYKDIDLPADPFDMEGKSRLVGCFEKYWKDYSVFNKGFSDSDENLEDSSLYAMDDSEISDVKQISDFKFLWHGTMMAEDETGNLKIDEIFSSFSQHEIVNEDCDGDFASPAYIGYGVDCNDSEASDLTDIPDFDFLWNGTTMVDKEKGNLKFDEIFSSLSRYEKIKEDYEGDFHSSAYVNDGVVCNEACDDGFTSYAYVSDKVVCNDSEVSNQEDNPDFDFLWNGTTMVEEGKGNWKFDGLYSSFSQYEIVNEDCDGSFHPSAYVSDGVVCNEDCNDGFASPNVSNGVVCEEHKADDSGCSEGDAPHDALFFALGYLGVKDLLVVERVCRSLRDAVRSDPLLWRTIQIEPPLSENISDDSIVKLSGRAQGILHCLNLKECSGITNSGLRRVLERNPRLTKLSVPGCPRLTVEGILCNLRAFNSVCSPGIKYLRIGGLISVTKEQFEELKSLLGADDKMQQRTLVPQYFCREQFSLSCDDDRAIDIDACPKCQKIGLIYDCPAESCRAKPDGAQQCRSCRLCISRCFECGRCFQDCGFEETFSLDFCCLDCFFRDLLIREGKMELLGDSSSKRRIVCQQMRYGIYIRG